jgi:acetyl-CoA carboxylase carboxyl transferase subunit beta
MPWFRRAKKGIKDSGVHKKGVPEGVWLKCRECTEILYRPEMDKSGWTCQKCGYHFRINSRKYLDILLDEGSFVEEDAHLQPADPLKFRDSKRYPDRVEAAKKKTGLNDAIIAGRGAVQRIPISIAALEFGYMGGSIRRCSPSSPTRGSPTCPFSRTPRRAESPRASRRSAT